MSFPDQKPAHPAPGSEAALAPAGAASQTITSNVGWVQIPLIGTEVKSSHPKTVLNPDDTFFVAAVRVDAYGVAVRGERTCWFSLAMISPTDGKEPSHG